MRLSNVPSRSYQPPPVSTTHKSTRGTRRADSPAAVEPSGAFEHSSTRLRQSESTTLHIVTQEGDRVRLKFRVETSARHETARVTTADGNATVSSVGIRSKSKISIKVHGDLNAEERAAIQDTLNQAMALADDFFAGDLQAAFESASALDVDGDQLAKVHLKMRLKQRVTYSAHELTRESVPSTGDGPKEAAVLSPRGVEVSGLTGSEAVGSPEVVPLAGAGGEGAESTEVSPDPAVDRAALRTIGNFLSQLLDKLGADTHGRHASALRLSLKIRIVQSTLTTLSEARPEEESPLPGLVPETLEALATQAQSPVDQLV